VAPHPLAFAVRDLESKQADVHFLIAPQVRYLGRPEEQATMFFLDPSESAIELKSLRNPAAVFSR
jgi:uncharacterized protein